MLHFAPTISPRPAPVSPLTLADRLIALAEETDRAGFAGTAARLVRLACAVLEELPRAPQ